MKVMKFGGGCLKDGESFTRAARLIRMEKENCAVVVSAVKGVTDLLAGGVREAASSGHVPSRAIAEIRARHKGLIDGSAASGGIRTKLFDILEEKLALSEKLLTSVSLAGEISPSLKAAILSTGERLAAHVLAEELRTAGVAAAAWESDEIGMVTDEVSENATVDLETFRENIARRAADIFRAKGIPVITGFFGKTPEGKVSTFGRNGSDYSAAVVAAALDASRLEIWKDVDGFMSADPGQVSHPVPIRRLSWLEAAELSYFGAKILHPRTFEPLSGRRISIVMKNFLAPENPGTEIAAQGIETADVVKSVTSNVRIALLRIHGPGVGFKPGVIGRIGRRLADRGINIYSVITAQTCINLLVDKADAGRSSEEIKGLANGVVQRIDARDDIALIAVVGQGLLHRPGVAARVLSAVSNAGINVEMISMGASDVAAYVIVERNRISDAVTAIHEEFFGQSRAQA